MFKRVIEFSGYRWKVRETTSPEGPGPNLYSSDNVWLEDDGLHLAITHENGLWHCAQIGGLQSFGYGRYIFYVKGWLDRLDENVVLGLFTWDDNSNDFANREIDIEFSRWGDPKAANGSYTVQPSSPRNCHQFFTHLDGTHTTQSFEWRESAIYFESYFGHYRTAPASNYINQCWIYRDEVFPPGDEVVAVNLWLMKGLAPVNQKPTEIVITKFEFIP